MPKVCNLPQQQSQDCFINLEEMLVDGVSFIAPSSAVITNPPHNGNFLIKVFNTLDPVTPVVQYGSGTFLDPSLGHYPADSNSTYPLVYSPGGDYFVIVETNDGIFNCGCLPIREWDMCEHSAQINYEGIANVPSFTFEIPIKPNQSSLQWSINADAFISDQMTIEYNGQVLLDTGQVFNEHQGDIDATGVTVVSGGGGPFPVENPFVYSPGVDFVTVTITPDPSTGPMTITFFSASVGCCEVSDPPFDELPELCPIYLGPLIRGEDPCSEWFSTLYPRQMDEFRFNSSPSFYDNTVMHDAESKLGSNGCIRPNVEIPFTFVTMNQGCNPVEVNSGLGCIDIGLVDDGAGTVRNHDCVGDELEITWTGPNSANGYATMKSWFQTMQSAIATAVAGSAQLQSSRNVTLYIVRGKRDRVCGSDGGQSTLKFMSMDFSMVVFDDISEKITISFDPDFSDSSSECCVSTPALTCTTAAAAFADLARAELTFIRGGKNISTTGALLDPSGQWYQKVFSQIGIGSYPVTNQGLKDYYMRVSVSDPTVWEYWVGDPDNGGVKKADSDSELSWGDENIPLLNSAGATHIGFGFGRRSTIPVLNADGCMVQGDSPSNCITDYEGLAQRLSDLTGNPFTATPTYAVFWTEAAELNYRPIKCNGDGTIDLSYYGGLSSEQW